MIELNAGGLSGVVKLTVKNDRGEVVRESAEFKNLITDFGLSGYAQFGDGPVTFATRTGFCAVGSSSIAPAVTDTALASQIGSRTSNSVVNLNVNTGAPDYIHRYVRTYQFPAGSIVGNVAEVGLFSASTGNVAATRALIKDGLGNPTTITVLADETLFVTYELRFVPNQSSATTTISISGTDYSVSTVARGYQGTNSPITLRFEAVTPAAFETQTVPALGVAPTGSQVSASSVSLAAHVAGSFYRDRTATWGPTVANFGTGIGTVIIGFGGPPDLYHFNVTFNNKVLKTNVQTFTFTIRLSVGRA